MDKDELKQRTKQFALRVITLTDHLPDNRKGRIIGDQLLRSATSVAANYRAACRARSTAEFIAKLGNVLEEADETAFWLEMIVDASLRAERRVASLVAEANELPAIIFTARRTTQRKILSPKS
ncbi:MAG TPA: four helix bundle protein [Chthoniobacterales bacterium]